MILGNMISNGEFVKFVIQEISSALLGASRWLKMLNPALASRLRFDSCQCQGFSYFECIKCMGRALLDLRVVYRAW